MNAYDTRRGNNNRGKQEKDQRPEKITIPLSKKYPKKEEIFLENGVAYKTAIKMGDIPPHQLRKVLNELKSAVSMIKQDESKFEQARNNLYYIVPLTAYNAGRNPKINALYDFVYSHINEKSIVDKEDIIVLDQLFTSIIAYHKLNSK